MTTGLAAAAPAPTPPGPTPPPARRERIVRGPADAVVTLVVGGLLGWAAWHLGRFVLVTGRWEIVRVNLTNLLVGLFPRDALWRPLVALALSVVALAFGAGATRPLPAGPRRRPPGLDVLDAPDMPLPANVPVVARGPLVPPPAGALRTPDAPGAFLGPLAPEVPLPLEALPAEDLPIPAASGDRPGAAGGRRAGVRGRLQVLGAAWPLVLLVAALAALTRSLVPVVALAALSVLAAGAWSVGRRVPRREGGAGASGWARAAPFGALAGLVAAVGILVGFGSPGWDSMGGLLLTLWLAIGGILLSFPAGVLLALGRRSSLPVVRAASTAYIELMRGVPLVALLFIGQLVIGYLLPPGAARPGDVSRALIAIVAFTAAYVAEIVRGGLQSIPKGQTDAAAALGLSSFAVQRLIVVPQALRAVIPALVGQFITLFKDTSLVSTIGLVELLGVSQAIPNQPRFLGQGQAEVLGFASFVFWVGAYSMSRASRRLERRLGVGIR